MFNRIYGAESERVSRLLDVRKRFNMQREIGCNSMGFHEILLIWAFNVMFSLLHRNI